MNNGTNEGQSLHILRKEYHADLFKTDRILFAN